MKLYLLLSIICAVVIWFLYGNYIEKLIFMKIGVSEKQKIIIHSLRLFSYSAIGVRCVMFRRETWMIDNKLNKYMFLYIASVLNLLFVAFIYIST